MSRPEAYCQPDQARVFLRSASHQASISSMAIPRTNRPWGPTRVRISSWTGRVRSIEHDDEEGMVVAVRGEGRRRAFAHVSRTPPWPALPDREEMSAIPRANRPMVAVPIPCDPRPEEGGKRAWSIGPSAMMPILVLTWIGPPPLNQGGHRSRPLRGIVRKGSAGYLQLSLIAQPHDGGAGQGLRSIQEVCHLLRMVDEFVQHVGAVRREEDLAPVRGFSLGNLGGSGPPRGRAGVDAVPRAPRG